MFRYSIIKKKQNKNRQTNCSTVGKLLMQERKKGTDLAVLRFIMPQIDQLLLRT